MKLKQHIKRLKNIEKQLSKYQAVHEEKLDLIQVDVTFLLNRHEKITKKELEELFDNVFDQDDKVYCHHCEIRRIKKIK